MCLVPIKIAKSLQFKTILVFSYSQIKLFVQINIDNFLFSFTQKKFFEQRAKSNEQQAKSSKQQAKSNELRAKSNKQRVKSNE